jgi:hypothetical protein
VACHQKEGLALEVRFLCRSLRGLRPGLELTSTDRKRGYNAQAGLAGHQIGWPEVGPQKTLTAKESPASGCCDKS